MFAVRRLEDGKVLVAKIIEDILEKTILEYLLKKDPTGKHVLPLEGSLSSNLGDIILLPVRNSVRQLIKATKDAYRGKLVSFAGQMIDAVWFLHCHGVAHLDIKADNFLYTDAYHIQIIDFGVAVQVKDKYDMVTDDVGSNGYRALETFTRDDWGDIKPYSPILADRYSLGVVVEELVRFDPDGNTMYREALTSFAKRLQNEDSKARPSLAEWHKLRLEANAENSAASVVPQKRPHSDDHDKMTGH